MSEKIENKFEYEDSCYNELIGCLNKAKEHTDNNGEELLDILGNFAGMYIKYYKGVVESGTNVGIETYNNFYGATEHNSSLLRSKNMLDEDSFNEVKEKIKKFYDATKLPYIDKDKGIGKK